MTPDAFDREHIPIIDSAGEEHSETQGQEGSKARHRTPQGQGGLGFRALVHKCSDSGQCNYPDLHSEDDGPGARLRAGL